MKGLLKLVRIKTARELMDEISPDDYLYASEDIRQKIAKELLSRTLLTPEQEKE